MYVCMYKFIYRSLASWKDEWSYAVIFGVFMAILLSEFVSDIRHGLWSNENRLYYFF